MIGILATALCWSAACSHKDRPQARVEIVDGVTWVHNPAAPAHPEMTVRFEEEMAIGEQDKAGQIVLYRPASFTVDPTGFVYISDSQDMNIKVFDPRGEYVRTIGRKGDGPGEFQGIASLSCLPGGRLAVLDWRARRTSFFDAEGKFLESYQWRNSHFTVFFATENSLTIDERIYGGEESQLNVKTFDLQGNEIVSFGAFTPAPIEILRRGNMAFGINKPFPIQSVFAGDKIRRLLYHCRNDRYLIEVYDEQGRLIRKIERPYERLPFTDEDREAYLHGFDNESNRIFAEMAKDVELPALKTVTEMMVVDDGGRLWVQTFEKRSEGDKVLHGYDVFDPEGIYETMVWLDVSPDYFQDGRMFEITSDPELGFRTLRRYKVVWTSGGAS